MEIKGKKIIGKKAGTVTLISASGEYRVNVTVEDPTIEGSVAKKPYKLNIENMTTGSTQAIRLKDIDQDVVFKSNKSNVAFISTKPNEDGEYLITARGKGTAKITAKVNGKTLTITVKVTG